MAHPFNLRAMAIVHLKVAQATESSRGGYIVKLFAEDKTTVQTPFGSKTAGSQQTYYIKLDEPPVVAEADLDLDMFEIVERPFTITDESSENFGETIQLKWLHLRK